MYNYKLTIQYDGGRYKGWQRLGNTENTIQGKIENVLSEMVGKKIEIIGSSRTDAGVHAIAQIANFKTSEKLSEAKINANFRASQFFFCSFKAMLQNKKTISK